ncbi:hypothetical protein P5765_26650 [Bacillus cereus]|uniref:hypothetical protein n=1 Tax=Bacillus cereus TaxID=1396 RepID=UPI0007AC05AA|nr:hypothetical protein [Bacillus cereus]KZD31813.1 hypothetical protein B4081_3249 [Bacillus cereus]MCC2397601.1 hypothetical protein [Bacillus cereus]MCU5662880.1 hypothetical protein [Bacillus cereus]MCU5723288.1 hypothetical protein [Bacillus cereus]MDF9655462.1 hypothetical protein [Bacillus cereus]
MKIKEIPKLILELTSKPSLTPEEETLLTELKILLIIAKNQNFSLAMADSVCKCCGEKYR